MDCSVEGRSLKGKARALVFWGSLAALLLCPVFVTAQVQNTGAVAGDVTDSQGKAVAHAEVTLTSLERGQLITAYTNDQGQYLFPTVPVGSYSLKVEFSGFKSFDVKGIVVDADRNLRVDAQLKPGDASATVVVEAENNSVDTQAATVGLLLDQDLVKDLPIDGNNVVSMSALLPGVTNVNAPTTFTSDTGGPTYNVNGARSTENLFLLDGAFWNNLYSNTGLNYPTPEALQEVSVQLNNFKAQYGRNVGSIFNAVTRSGTNKFHFSLYDYIQNKFFNAADYLSQRNPKLVQNQFGGTLSGPILKDKLFFFFSYQDLRAAQTNTQNAGTFPQNQRGVDANGNPTPCSSTGLFAGQNCATNLGKVQNPLYTGASYGTYAIAPKALNAAYVQAGGTLAPGQNSPCVTELQAALASSGQYITNAELPYVCLNPVMLKLLQYVPLPNTSSGLATTLAPSPKNDKDLLIRGDYTRGAHSFDARYYHTSVDDLLAKSSGYGTGVATYEIDRDSGGIEFGNIGDTWMIRTNLLNVLRLNYKRYTYDILPTDHTTLAGLGANFASSTTVPMLPEILANGAFTLGSSGMGQTNSVNEDIELVDTLSWVHGRHNIQTGLDALRLQYYYKTDTVPYFQFGVDYTTTVVSDFLLGLPRSMSVGNQMNRAGVEKVLYTYVQDDWRIAPRLTLNLGVRYELPFPYRQPKNQSETFIPGYQSEVYPLAPPSLAFVGDPGVSRDMTPMRYNDVAPRFGFAYDPFGRGTTSIRGGAGLFYSATNALVIGVGEPFNYKATYAYPEGGISQPLLNKPAVPANWNGRDAEFVSPFNIFYTDKSFRAAYTEAFNLGVQQMIHGKGMLEVNYIGRLGRHQPIPLDQNPAIYDCSGLYYAINPTVYCTGAAATDSSYTQRMTYPGFNYGGQGVVDYQSIGTSAYNAMQIVYTQKGMRGISLTSSFTYSRSTDEQSDGTTTTNTTPRPWDIKSQYGLSDFNSKLNLTLGWRVAPTRLHIGNRELKMLLNGWVTSGSFSARTGSPLNITIPSDTALTDEPRQRAAYSTTSADYGVLPSFRHRWQKVAEYFDTAAFATPKSTTALGGTTVVDHGIYSNLSRNSLTGPAYTVTNVSVGRIFAMPYLTGAKLNMNVQAFNLFNIPNLSSPNTTYWTSTCQTNTSASGCYFGHVLTTAGTNSFVGTNGRRLQISLKLSY